MRETINQNPVSFSLESSTLQFLYWIFFFFFKLQKSLYLKENLGKRALNLPRI